MTITGRTWYDIAPNLNTIHAHIVATINTCALKHNDRQCVWVFECRIVHTTLHCHDYSSLRCWCWQSWTDDDDDDDVAKFSIRSRLVWKPYGHNTLDALFFISFGCCSSLPPTFFFSFSLFLGHRVCVCARCLSFFSSFLYRFRARSRSSHYTLFFVDFLVSVAFSSLFGILSRAFGELSYFLLHVRRFHFKVQNLS